MTFVGQLAETNSAETKKTNVASRTTADIAAIYSPGGVIFESFWF